jgi:DNA modification methylase
MGRSAKAGAPALEVEVVSIDALTLDPRNARKHGRRNLAAIKASLEQFGQRRPLVVRADLQVIAGNGTLEAIRDLRWSEVAITRVPAGWTDDQVRAYAIADNRTAELAEWDDVVLADMLAELDAGGWDLNSLGFDGMPELAPGDSDDDLPETNEAAPTAKLGDVWELGEHRVACGSSTDPDLVARLFAGRAAQAVITDPPYGVAYESRGRKTAHRAIAGDDAGDAELGELVAGALGLAFVNLEEGGACYVFHGDSRRVVFERAMAEVGYLVHQTLVWVKDSFVLARLDYQPQHEPILYGWRPGGRHAWYGGRKHAAIIADQQPDLDTLDRDELVALLREIYEASDVIRHDRPRRSDSHPTMKPVGLLSRLIVNSTKKGGLVYDPFLGSGSTLIAAERQGRVCYGVELDPVYVDVVVSRWETVTSGKARLAS